MAKEIVMEISESEWEQRVEKADIPVAVMFYSPACAHCHAMEPYFRKYAEENADSMRFIRINVMTSKYVTSRYGIMATPTFKFFCQGSPVQELVGEIYPPLLKKTIEVVLRDGIRCIKNSTKIDYEISGYT